MTANGDADLKPLPGTVFNARQVRVLKVAVIAMGIALVGGFVFLIAAIVYQANQQGATGEPETPATLAAPAPGLQPGAGLALPPGASVSHLALDGDRLALHVESASGPEIIIFDLRSGQVVSRVRLRAE